MSGKPGANSPEGPEIIGEVRARQGRTGMHALIILLSSLALALVAALLLGLI